MEKILYIALEIAKGMEHIHHHNLIHGDLSSNNVLLKSKAGLLGFTCKITDFGKYLIVLYKMKDVGISSLFMI